MADEITNDFNLISIVIRNLDARECIFDQYHQFEAIIRVHVEFVTEMRFIRNSFDAPTR
jgi:hypothetical protein